MSDLKTKVKHKLLVLQTRSRVANERDADEIISLCQPQWISVDTELPKDNTNCRVLVGGIEQRTFHRRYNDKWIYMDDSGIYQDSSIGTVISHYYVCPKPPEESK